MATTTVERGARIFDTAAGSAGTVHGHDGDVLLVHFDGTAGLHLVQPEHAVVAPSAPVWKPQQLTITGATPDALQGALF